MGAALVFRDVWKRYGGVEALRGASFSIPEGVLAGLVGPNGSGKTTSFRLALGFSRPTRGSVEVLGRDPFRDEGVRREVGYLPEKPVYPQGVDVESFLVHVARLRGVGDPVGEARRIAKLVGLGERMGQLIGSLSRGYLQRLGLAYAFLGGPRLLLLDEPTANLDPAARVEILDLVRVLSRDLGATVVVSTHILPEVQRVADYLVVLAWGRVVDYGPLPELVTRYRAEAFYEAWGAPGALREAASQLIRDEAVRGVELVDSGRLVVKTVPGAVERAEALLAELQRRGLIEGFVLRSGSLEDIYFRLVGGGDGGLGG